MNFFRDRAGRGRGGFTLVELLVVIVIIGVMALMIGPTFTTGSDIARVKTASRGMMQMSRYARTMAVLYQTPMALVISADGGLRVERGQGGNEAPAVAVTPEASDRSAPPDRSDPSDGGGGRAQPKGKVPVRPLSPDPADPADGDGGASYVMADLNAEKIFEQVTFTVELDQDALEEDEADVVLKEEEKDQEDNPAGGIKTIRIPYESNGRCLPYTVRIQAAGDDGVDALTVAVDRFGVAKILNEDE